MDRQGQPEEGTSMIRVLFVCLGNICRSPTAQGVFEHLVAEAGWQDSIEADSDGTHAYHAGEAPDRRAQMEAAQRGVDLSGQRARAVAETDFARLRPGHGLVQPCHS